MRYEDLTSEQVRQIAEFEAACEAQAQPVIEVGMMVTCGMTEGRVDRIVSPTEVLLSRPTKNSKRWSRWSWVAPIATLTATK